MRLERRLKRYLLNGILIIVPIGISFLVVVWFITTVDRTIAPPIERLLGAEIPGLGLVAALVMLVAAGALGSNIAGQYLLEVAEGILLKIPVFNWLYRTVKQVTELFSPGGKVRFRTVVLVEYPCPGTWSLGFVTNELTIVEDGTSEALVCVYVPSNHLHVGQTVLVPKKRVRATGLNLQAGIQGVISAGASLPPRLEK